LRAAVFFVFGLLLQAQCLHLLGVLAELGGDLHSQTAEAHISDMGSATVWVDKELDAGDVKGLDKRQ
jgi:hypothetical protein